MKGVFSVAFVISVGVCIGVGCAKSEEDDLLYGKAVDKTEPVDAGTDATKTRVVPKDDDDDSTGDDDDDDDDTTSSSSSSSSTGGSSSSSTSSSSSSSSSSSGGSSSGTDPCKALTCTTAKAQTPISGDTGNPARTLTGATTQWFTINVTEDNNSISGQALRLRASLTSPPGKNFDLFVYRSETTNVKECHANEESSELAAGQVDKVSISWGEADGDIPNFTSDEATITIGVKEIVDPALPAATCDPTAKWTLKLEGNK